MNKRVLFFSGGLFTVLLASLAVYQTYYDQSSFQASNVESLKVLQSEKSISFQQEILAASGSTSTASKVNITRLTNAYTEVYKDLIPSTDLRLTAFASTDRYVYRNTDVMFLEVFLFDSLKKTPYISTGKNLAVKFTLYDSTGTQQGTAMSASSTTFGPTFAYAISIAQLKASLPPDTYTIVITNVVSPPTNPKAFAEISTQFQIRAYNPTMPMTSNSAYGTSIEVFGTYTLPATLGTSSTTIYGKLVASTDCTSYAPGLQVTYFSEMYGVSAPPTDFFTLTNKFARDNQLYFSISVSNSKVAASLDNTIQLSLDPSIPVTTACGQGLSINIPFQETFVPTVWNIEQLTMDFFSEANTDLVPNTTQKIYFNTYFYSVQSYNLDKSVNAYTQESVTFQNGNVYAYNIMEPFDEPMLLASNINSDANGHGMFSVTIPDQYMLFIEFQLEGYMDALANQYEITLPFAETISMGDGYVRVPIYPESITGFQETVTLQRLMKQAAAATTPSELVSAIQQISFNYADTTLGLNYHFQDGLFVIQDSDHQTLAKFNSFPNPNNFTDTVLYSYVLTYPNANDVTNVQVAIKSYDFKNVINQLAVQTYNQIQAFLTTPSLTLTGFTAAGANIGSKIHYLCQLFAPTSDLPYAEITVYNEDGPVADFIEGTNGYEYMGDTVFDAYNFEYPSITFSLNNNVLGSQDDLVVTFQTNNYMDPTKAYLLTVKQKEQVIYSEAFSFSQNTNQKRTIPYGKLNRLNGGVFSVDLYKLQDLYLYFQGNVSSTTLMCDLNSLSSQTLAFYGADGTNLQKVDGIPVTANLVSGTLIKTNNIWTPTVATVKAAGYKSCVVDSPELLNNFITHVAAAQLFRRPQPAISVEVDTTKDEYQRGETVTVTVTLTNMTDGTTLINSGAYLSLIAVQDLQFDAFAKYDTSLGEKLYISNDIDTQNGFDLSDAINKQYDSTLSTVTDFTLQYAMSNQLDYNSVFEPDTLLNSQYYTTFQQSFTPLNYYELSQAFGYNFKKFSTLYTGASISSISFKQTDIEQYISPTNNNADYSSDLTGYYESYPNSMYQSPIGDATYDPLGYAYLKSTPTQVTSAYAQKITAANYDRTAQKYLREVLYYQSGLPITSAQTTYTFQTGDLDASYKVKAVVVHPNGIGFSQTSFTVSEPFDVSVDTPDIFIVGDTYTVTANLINFTPETLNVTVTRTDGDSNSATTSKVYVNLATAKYVAVNQGSGVITFTIVANKQVAASSISLTFTAVGVNSGVNYVSVVPINVVVDKSYPYRHQYFSGDIYSQYSAATPDVAQFTFTTPQSAADIATLQGDVTFYADRFSLYYEVTKPILDCDPSEFSNFFANGQEVVTGIDELYQLSEAIAALSNAGGPTSANSATTTPIQTYFYTDRLTEIKEQIVNLYMYLQETYSISNSTQCIGWDYYENNYQGGGSLVLTAYTLQVLTNVANIIFTQQGSTANPITLDSALCYRQSLAWILEKQVTEYDEVNKVYNVVGNYTMDPLDVDAEGRAPWNITQAYVTYCLLLTVTVKADGTVTLTDMGPQLKFLATQVQNSFTFTGGVFSLNLDSDPYYIALAYNAFSNAQQLTQGDIIKLTGWANNAAFNSFLTSTGEQWIAQIRLHQFSAAHFTNGNNSFDSFRPAYSYTPFNTYKTDRVIETTAQVIQAIIGRDSFMSSYSTTSQTSVQNAIQFIKTYCASGTFGSTQSTAAALLATALFEDSLYSYQSQFATNAQRSFNYFTDQFKLAVSSTRNYKTPNEALEGATYYNDVELPRTIEIFNVGTTSGWQYGDYEITIQVATTNPASTPYTRYFYLTWMMDISHYDQNYLGDLSAADSRIYLQVDSNGDLNTAALDTYVNYQITLMNYDRGRSHNGAVFTIRPSACLDIDDSDLAYGVTQGDYTSYQIDYVNHLVYIYVRGVGPFGYPTFTLSFNKGYSGTCTERYFSAALYQFADSEVHAYPVDVNVAAAVVAP